MTLLEKERSYWENPGSFSIDIDTIRSQTKVSNTVTKFVKPTNAVCKFIVMGRCKVIEKSPLETHTYRVTFHETWTREE